MNNSYPILEFDSSPQAFIEPSKIIKPREVSPYCVISFFKEVIEKTAIENNARIVVENRWEDGIHPLYEINTPHGKIAFMHGGIGAPLSAGLLEEAIGFGCNKFIVCGGCGVLVKDMVVGHLVIITSAIRDEGTSYHYLAPSREIETNSYSVLVLEKTLADRGLPYCLGKSWTTDAPYRETENKIKRRKQEGCIVVEMEAAALLAVSQFRNVILGQVLYGGDDLSGERWDNRGWQSRKEIRESLFWLSVEACLQL